MKKDEFIALGVDEELAVKLEEASLNELKGFIPKSRFDEVNEAKKKQEEMVKERDTQLEDLQKKIGKDVDLSAEIERLKAENEESKKQYEADLYQTQLNNEIDKSLMAAKAKDVSIAKAAFNLTDVKLSEDGKLIGFDEQLKSITESHAYLFETEEKPSGTGGSLGNKGKNNDEVDPFLKGMGLV